MTPNAREAGSKLSALLNEIVREEALARHHDRFNVDRDRHAAAAQLADERAEAARCTARSLIESAFPGVSWPMIERAIL